MPFWRPRIHFLNHNRDLNSEQYSRCVSLIANVQGLYDGASDYVSKRGLDPTIAFAGNEWARIPRSGIQFRSEYININYLRLLSSFSGYSLLFLDRLYPRKYPGDGAEEFEASVGDNLPDDIADILPKRFNVSERLGGMAVEQRKFTRKVPPRYVVSVPRMMGEIGLNVRGVVVNPDTLMTQSRINAMLTGGIIDKLWDDIRKRGRARILEVGAGHGALAHALKAIFRDALEVVIVDLPMALYHSAVYLNAVVDGIGFHLAMPGAPMPERFGYLLVANYLLDEFENRLGPIDMAINTMSFQEMSVEQVRTYACLFDRLLRPDGVVFDENENSALLSHHVDSCQILENVFPGWNRIESWPLMIERKSRVWRKCA